MKWIIEAGTTKTDSALITDGQPCSIETSPGLNPMSDKTFHDKLKHLCQSLRIGTVDEVHFYGSGCINKKVNQSIQKTIEKILTVKDKIVVDDDLTGAAISLCGNQAGIVGILGTGSNIGYYNGKKINDRIQSCGYLLGDEGSGYRIGQNIYLRFCRGLLSQEDISMIEEGAKIKRSNSVMELYQNDNQRQYLANFSNYIDRISTDSREEILEVVFHPFLNNIIRPMYKKHQTPIHLVGSIAFHFEERLRSMFNKFDIIAGSFVKSPINGLIKHHEYE